jgi:tRNA-binding protein
MHLVHDPAAPTAPQISFDQFLAVDIRVGTVIGAELFPEARKPALRLTVDFGAGIGTKRSSAQITENYEIAALIGRQVAAVVNFPPRQIGKFMSEVLVLGFPDEQGKVTLFAPDKRVPNGGRLF